MALCEQMSISSGSGEPPCSASADLAISHGPDPPKFIATAGSPPQVIRRRKPKPKDRYVIERLIGQGGMGAVYKARDLELGRVVALKLLHPAGSLDDESEERLKKELLLASKVSHPRVVRVHDFGEMRGTKFISMAFIDGENLKSLLVREGRIPIPRAVHIAAQLCEGLSAAHAEGVIHRDLKPHNILLDCDGNVYISDFGLARSSADPSTDIAKPGDRPGSPAYMSPEQALGLPVDHRTDLYALGLVLYEMVTAKLPSSATASLLLHGRFECRVKSPAALNPEVPESLDRLILRCLEVDRAKRPQSALQLLEELKTLSPSERLTTEAPKRWPKKAGIGAAVATLVLGALAISFSSIWRVAGGKDAHVLAGQHLSSGKLAITPLRVIGDASSLHVIADTLTEALSSRAAQSGRARLFLDDAGSTAAEKGCRTRADVAIAGSVRAEGNQILATIHLTDCATGEERWTSQFRASPGRLVALEDQIWAGTSNALGWNADRRPLPALLHATHNLEAYKLYMQGKLLMRMHRNRSGAEQAVRLFEEASKLDPGYFYPYVALADANLIIFKDTQETASLEKAKQFASRAQELSLNRPEAQVEVAKIQIATGQYPEAIGLLQRAIDRNPASDEAYRTLGRADLLSGHREEAIAAYRKAVDLDGHSWRNHNALGVALFSLGRLDEAERAFKEAIRLEPQISDNYTNLGNTYLQAGRFQESVRFFEKAIALEADAVNYSNLGTALFYLGQGQQAGSMFERAVQADPKSEVLTGNLADAYRWSNQKRKALETYFRAVALGSEALDVNPMDAGIRGRMATYYAKMDDFETARASILAALSLDPENASVQYDEAVVSTLGFNLVRAERELKAAIKNGYPVPLALNDPELRPLHPDKVLGSSPSHRGV